MDDDGRGQCGLGCGECVARGIIICSLVCEIRTFRKITNIDSFTESEFELPSLGIEPE